MPIPVTRHGMGTSPIIKDDLVILNCFGVHSPPYLLAVNKYDGKTVWSTLGNPDRREQFPGFKDLAAQYDRNEDMILNKDELEGFKFRNYPDIEVEGEISVEYYLKWWDQNTDGLIDSTEYNSRMKTFESAYEKQGLKAIKLGGEGNIKFTNFLWASSDHVPMVTSPLYYNNNVYMVKSGGMLSCFNAENGEINVQFIIKLGVYWIQQCVVRNSFRPLAITSNTADPIHDLF